MLGRCARGVLSSAHVYQQISRRRGEVWVRISEVWALDVRNGKPHYGTMDLQAT